MARLDTADTARFAWIRSPLLEWALDALSCIVLSLGAAISAYNIAGFSTDIWKTLLCILAALAAVLLVTRRWWALPALIAVPLLAWGGFLLSREHLSQSFLLWLEEISVWWDGFFQWIGAGFPQQLPYSEDSSIWIVQASLAVPITAVIYFFLRRCFSFAVLSALSIAGCFFLWVGRYTEAGTVLAILLAGLVLVFPRPYFAQLRKKLSANTRITRGSMQLIAVPAAAVCVLLAQVLIPPDTSEWKSSALIHVVNDINDYVGFYSGTSLPYRGFSIGPSGYLPMGERLGGPIHPNDNTVMTIETESPFFLRGGIQDGYGSNAWWDSWSGGRCRWDSLLWRGHRNDAFQHKKVPGGREAADLYKAMTRDVTAKVTYQANGMTAMFSAGQGQIMRLKADRDSRFTPYFNMQTELFASESIPAFSSYLLTAKMLDRSLPGFHDNMIGLEKICSQYPDKEWDGICARYLHLPDTLPDTVKKAAANIVRDAVTPYERAVALETWLRENCTYTPAPDAPPEDQDFVEHFLATREGYCVYYATAMSVMARCAGLPSRYVTGYGMKPASRSGSYKATNATAHAWTEIYFQGIGWLTFDPLDWDLVVDVMEELIHPKKLAKEPEKSAPETEYLPETEPEMPREPEPVILDVPQGQRQIPWILFGLIGAALLFGGLRLSYPWFLGHIGRMYQLGRVTKKRAPGQALEYYYRDILRQLAWFDETVQPGDTLQTFSQRADLRIKISPCTMGDICGAVAALRFGLQPPDGRFLQSVSQYHEALEEKVAEKLGAGYFVRRVLPSYFRRGKR